MKGPLKDLDDDRKAVLRLLWEGGGCHVRWIPVATDHFKMWATVTNQNLIQKEIKRKLNYGSPCYHLVQNLASSRLLSKNVKMRTYNTIIFPVDLYGCDT
jgi:hypothetical protein